MMNMLQVDNYCAWISIGGAATEVHEIERNKNTITCWIASEVGKNFSVNWYNSTREIALQGVVTIDGLVCDTHIMLDAPRYPNKPNGIGVSYSRTSDYTQRDFVFSEINVTDDDAYLHTIDATFEIGTIKLELWRLNIVNVETKPLEHQYGAAVLESQVVHERSKKAGAHYVTFGDEYASPAPTVDMVQGYNIDTEPLLTFIFRYRPHALLMAHGIIPKPILQTSQNQYQYQYPITDTRTAAEIRRLEARLNNLRSNANHSPNTSVPSNRPLAQYLKLKMEPQADEWPVEREVIDLT